MNPERLSSCDRYHKNEPADMAYYWTIDSRRKTLGPVKRRHCQLCDRYRRLKPRKPPRVKKDRKGTEFQPYGYIPLTWKPPVL